jgi:glycosyltransferase involved in cell wall biosynthesis
MENTKFSIIIPTRNRASTLYWTIKTCLEQDYDNYEIIISDNNSQDNTKQVVEGFNSDKIKYFHTEYDLSMTDNWEFGLSKASGDYVAIIGDDDSIMPNAFKKVNQLIKETNADSILSRYDTYIWNNFPLKNSRGVLKYDVFKKTKWFNSIEQIEYVLKNTSKFTSLPCISLAFTKRSVIQKIASKTNGVFFQSSIPDVFSSFVIALEVKEFLYVNDTFFLPGASAASNGVSFMLKESDKSIFKNFLSSNTIPIHPKIIINKSLSIFCSEVMMQIKDKYNYEVNFDSKDIIKNAFKEINYLKSKNDFEDYKNSLLKMIELNNIQDEELISKVEKLRFKGVLITSLLKYFRDLNPIELKNIRIVRHQCNNIYEASIINSKINKNSILINNHLSILFVVLIEKILNIIKDKFYKLSTDTSQPPAQRSHSPN